MESEVSSERATGPSLARIERLLEYAVGLLGVVVMLLFLQPGFAVTRP